MSSYPIILLLLYEMLIILNKSRNIFFKTHSLRYLVCPRYLVCKMELAGRNVGWAETFRMMQELEMGHKQVLFQHTPLVFSPGQLTTHAVTHGVIEQRQWLKRKENLIKVFSFTMTHEKEIKVKVQSKRIKTGSRIHVKYESTDAVKSVVDCPESSSKLY